MRIKYVVTALIVVALFAVLLGIKQTLDSLAGLPDKIVETAHYEQKAAIESISKIFHDAFQIEPKIQENTTVLREQTAAIAELAVVERIFSVSYEWNHIWMGSQKSIELHSKFKAKAGFDLREPFLVTIHPDTGRIEASLPPAKILGVEPVGEILFGNSDGWWNRIAAEDREQALNAFLDSARKEAISSTLCAEAEQEALVRLQELSHENNQRMIFSYRLRDSEKNGRMESDKP